MLVADNCARELGLDLADDAHALPLREGRAGDAGQHDEPDGRQGAEHAADAHEQAQLHEGDHDEQERQDSHGRLPCPNGRPLSTEGVFASACPFAACAGRWYTPAKRRPRSLPMTNPEPAAPALPDNIRLLPVPGREVHLVGTAHVSEASVAKQ